MLAFGLVGRAVGSARQVAETERTSESYPVEGATSLRVANGNGSVAVATHDAATVDVTVTKTSSAGRAAFERTHVRQRIEGETFVLETAYEDGETALVDYEILVPEDLAVAEVRTANGDISVEGTAGDLSATATNGTVEAVDVEGYVDLATTNGDAVADGTTGVDGIRAVNGAIDADVAAIRRDVTVGTGNGDVVVRVGPDLDADLSASAGIGAVELGEDVSLADERVAESAVSGRLGDGGNRLDVSTDIGTVVVDAMT